MYIVTYAVCPDLYSVVRKIQKEQVKGKNYTYT